MSFNHFGQADMGSFLILMGVWETAAYVAFFHSVVSEFMEQEKDLMAGLFVCSFC